MSNPTLQQKLETFQYMGADHLPDAHWIVGGGFRFDHALLSIHEMLKNNIGARQINEAYATIPTRFSLSWYHLNQSFSDSQTRIILASYNKKELPLNLSFDKPFIDESQLVDSFSFGLVSELIRQDKKQQGGLFVANDKLALTLRKHFPNLRLSSHVNRLISERQRRTPQLYKKLLDIYDRVTLHPNDALKPSMYEAIEDKSRCICIVNDPCLQSCPVRYEHLRNLSKQRDEPFKSELRWEEQQLIKRVNCQQIGSLLAGQSCNLSIQQMQQLYAVGYRNFAIQAERFRHPSALLWDIFNSIFTHAPEHSNKIAALRANAIASIANDPRPRLKSGMPKSSLDEY